MGQREETDQVGEGFLQVTGTKSTEKLRVPKSSLGSSRLTHESIQYGKDMPIVEQGPGLNYEKII